MKQYIKTSWYYHFFKEDHSSKSADSKQWKDGVWERNNWSVNRDSLKEGMDGLSKYCNDNNYEIKGIIPIDRAQSYEYGQSYVAQAATGYSGWGYGWGLGQGWGITMTDGFAAMLQSIEMLSDEEYDKRIEEDKRIAIEKEEKKKKVDELTGKIDKLKKLIEETGDREAHLKMSTYAGVVETTKGLFKKKAVYRIGGEEYPNKEEAEAVLKALLLEYSQAGDAIKASEKLLSEYQEALNRCVNELAEIEGSDF